MDALHDSLWIFNFLYFWIVFFLVSAPLVGSSEIPAPEMDPHQEMKRLLPSGKSFHEDSEESSQKQKKP